MALSPPPPARSAVAHPTGAIRRGRRPSVVRRFIFPFSSSPASAMAAMAYDWFVEGRFLVSTDDAYVGADMAIIAAKASGHLTEVAVAQNQVVHAGDLLAAIDDGDYERSRRGQGAHRHPGRDDRAHRPAGRRAGAVIAQAEAQIGSARAQAERRGRVERAALEFDRSQKLAQTNFGSQQRLEQATADRDRTTAALAAAKASRLPPPPRSPAPRPISMSARRSGTRPTRPRRTGHRPGQGRARPFLHPSRAPFDGVVGNKAVELGQYAQPGARLMALVPLDASYVDANFKETQLADIQPGQKVDVAVDASTARWSRAWCHRSRRPRARSSRCCRPTTRPAISPRSCSGSRCASPSPRKRSRRSRLRPGLSVVATVHTRDPTRRSRRCSARSGSRRRAEAPSREQRASRYGPAARPGRRPRRRAGGVRSAFSTSQARRLHLHGVRDVHGDPGHPDRLGLAFADPGGALGFVRTRSPGSRRAI